MLNFILHKNAAFLKWMFEELWVKETTHPWQMALSRCLFRCDAPLRQRVALVRPARATSEVLPLFTKNVASRVYHVFSAKVRLLLLFTLTWIMWYQRLTRFCCKTSEYCEWVNYYCHVIDEKVPSFLCDIFDCNHVADESFSNAMGYFISYHCFCKPLSLGLLLY